MYIASVSNIVIAFCHHSLRPRAFAFCYIWLDFQTKTPHQTVQRMSHTHHLLATSNPMYWPKLVLEFTSTKHMTTCTLVFNQVKSCSRTNIKYTVLLSYCIETSSHTCGCILELISAEQMTQQQGGRYYSFQQQQYQQHHD